MHDLVFRSRRSLAAGVGLFGLGVLLERHPHIDLGAKGLLVELDSFIATAFKKEIGLYLHDNSCKEGRPGGAARKNLAIVGTMASGIRQRVQRFCVRRPQYLSKQSGRCPHE
ncbi:hypothetical protein D9M70_550900 [compost metagenome]